MEIFKKFKQFENWFDLKFGWFFTNGNKTEKRENRLKSLKKEKI